MRRIKFLHFADMHLDASFSVLCSEELAAKRRKDLLTVFSRIIMLAENEQPDVILISGDLFEHQYVRKTTIKQIHSYFQELENIPVVILPGNHDPFVNNSYYNTFTWSQNVHILSPHKTCYENKKLGLRVYTLEQKVLSDLGEIEAFNERLADNEIHVAMIHGTPDITFNDSAYQPFTISDIEHLNMDYFALGHFHTRILEGGRRKRVFNPGSPEPMGFDEEGTHSVILGDITKREGEASEIAYRCISLNSCDYQRVDMNLSGCRSTREVILRIMERLESEDKSNILYKILLKGELDSHAHIDLNEVEEHLNDQFLYVKLVNQLRVIKDIQKIENEPGIRGAFISVLKEWIEKETDDNIKKLYEKSILYGLEALEGQKIEIMMEDGDLEEDVY